MKIEIINHLESISESSQLMDRGFLFGDGFFTTGIIENNQLLNQSAHYQRLLEAANLLKFDNFSIAPIEEIVQKICNKQGFATIRISVSRQQLQRGYAISPEASSHCHIYLSNLTLPPQLPCELSSSETPVSSNPLLAGIKHLNRLDSVMAATEITGKNHEVLMYHNDSVICGSKTNLFVRLQGQWQTPSLELCGVRGLTRQRTIDAFLRLGIECKINSISRSDLEYIDAAFVTNSLVGLWPASSINGRTLDAKRCHAILELVTR